MDEIIVTFEFGQTVDLGHWGAIQLQPNSSLPGRHSNAHCSKKDGENKTGLGHYSSFPYGPHPVHSNDLKDPL